MCIPPPNQYCAVMEYDSLSASMIHDSRLIFSREYLCEVQLDKPSYHLPPLQIFNYPDVRIEK